MKFLDLKGTSTSEILKKNFTSNIKHENEIVLSLGGGTPCYFDNIDKIISATKIILSKYIFISFKNF